MNISKGQKRCGVCGKERDELNKRDDAFACYGCTEKLLGMSIQGENEENLKETADTIQCPYCQHLMGYDDLEVGDMSGESEMDCEKCKKRFNVDFYSIYYFTSSKLEGTE
ncbi:hypothetical protein ACRYKL_14330 [Bacillus velezensis]|uniref:hypothetical protein n=1 Tax=Bacillus velezensis TaxID=492670 RepID=UPI003EBD036A